VNRRAICVTDASYRDLTNADYEMAENYSGDVVDNVA
jgi:hypothetical protein